MLLTSATTARQLLLLPHVLFAGYKVPHPLEPQFIIKIQTSSESTPIQAVQEACKGLIVTLSKMRDALQKEFVTARAIGGDALGALDATGVVGNEGLAGEGMYGAGASGLDDAPSGFGEWVQ